MKLPQADSNGKIYRLDADGKTSYLTVAQAHLFQDRAVLNEDGWVQDLQIYSESFRIRTTSGMHMSFFRIDRDQAHTA